MDILTYSFLSIFFIFAVIKVKVEVAQLLPTLGKPMDCSLPGFSIHGSFQARILEWVAISFSSGSSQPRDRTQVSRIAGRCFTFEPPGKPSSVIGSQKKSSILLIWPRLCDPCEDIWAEFSHSKVSYKRGQGIFGASG